MSDRLTQRNGNEAATEEGKSVMDAAIAGTQSAGLLVLDPTAERAKTGRTRAPRLTSFTGCTVGLLDISKPRGDVFLDRIEAVLRERGADVIRFKKPTFAKPAPLDLRQEIAERCDAVIEALAD